MSRPSLPQFEHDYDSYKMRTLVDELNRWIETVESGVSGAGGGLHNNLTGRGDANAHPIVAITGLRAELDGLDGRIIILEGASVAANAQRVDDTTSSTVFYFGEAVPGTADAAALWRVSRGTFITPGEDDFELEWADGDNLFNNVWDDRLILSYS